MTVPEDRSTQPTAVGLFQDLSEPCAAQVAQAQSKVLDQRSQGTVRLLRANRSQVELRASDLESLLPLDHRARLVWGYVERQNLSRVIAAIKAVAKFEQQTKRYRIGKGQDDKCTM